MTGRKQAFIEAITGEVKISNTEAAIIAGYSPKTAKQAAYKLLHNAEVAAEIERIRRERHAEKTAEAAEVEEFLTSVMRGDEVDTVIITKRGGGQTFADGKPSARDRLKAAELLGKRWGLFDASRNAESSAGGIILIPEVGENGE